jgi:hypothetical protein
MRRSRCDAKKVSSGGCGRPMCALLRAFFVVSPTVGNVAWGCWFPGWFQVRAASGVEDDVTKRLGRVGLGLVEDGWMEVPAAARRETRREEPGRMVERVVMGIQGKTQDGNGQPSGL